MRLYIKLRLLLTIITLFFIIPTSSAIFQNNTLLNDSTVNQASPTTNYPIDCVTDSPSCFEVNYVSGSEVVALVYANTTGIPAGSIVSNAKLYIYLKYSSVASIKAYGITSAWTETGVTWNTRPTRKVLESTTAISGTGYKQINITNIARGWVNGSITNYGIYLNLTVDDGQIYTSKESATNKPYISYTYTAGSVNVYTINVSQSLLISNNINKISILERNAKQSLSLSDNIDRFLTSFREAKQSFTIDNNMNRFIISLRKIDMSFSMVDTIKKLMIFTRSSSQSLNIDNAVNRLSISVRSVNQALSISDSMNRLITSVREAKQSFTIDNSMNRFVISLRNVYQSFTVDNVTNRLLIITRTVSQSFTMTDYVKRTMTFIRVTELQAITITNTITKDVSKIYTVVVGQTLTFVGSIYKEYIVAGRYIVEGWIKNNFDVFVYNARVSLLGFNTTTDTAGHYQFVNLTNQTTNLGVNISGYYNTTPPVTISGNTTFNVTLNQRNTGTQLPGFDVSIGLLSIITILLYIKKRRKE